MSVSTEAPVDSILTARQLYKTFPGTQALKGVSLTIRPNEIVGIVGENGAGKSTLLKILAGIQQPDRGELWLRGERVYLRSVREAARLGINMVSQEGSLLPNLSVAENIYLGNESAFVERGAINWQRLRASAQTQLSRVGCEVDPRLEAGQLPIGQRQMVELARVLALHGSEHDGTGTLIILDEPTSALTRGEVERLFAIVRDIRRYGSLVFVSHRLDEVLEISDRICVLRDGLVTGEVDTYSTNAAALQQLMVGRELDHEYYRENLQHQAGSELVISVEGLAVKGSFSEVSFEVRAGEVLGLCGAEGSGCEAVLRTLAGIRHPSAGTVTLAQGRWSCSSTEEASRRGIAYIPADRGREGLVLPLSVTHNITLPRLGLISSVGLLNPRKERALVSKWIEKLRVRCPSPSVPAGSLSGGNQQKVVLSKWLAAQVNLLLLDHPTRGIDVGAKEEVYQIIRDLTSQGMAMLLVSDTLEEAIGLSHRLVCMRDGRITAVLDASIGHKPSPLTVLSHIV
jgi:ribose transport system ATP-binding protein